VPEPELGPPADGVEELGVDEPEVTAPLGWSTGAVGAAATELTFCAVVPTVVAALDTGATAEATTAVVCDGGAGAVIDGDAVLVVAVEPDVLVVEVPSETGGGAAVCVPGASAWVTGAISEEAPLPSGTLARA
jgi:hypothetical protein